MKLTSLPGNEKIKTIKNVRVIATQKGGYNLLNLDQRKSRALLDLEIVQ